MSKSKPTFSEKFDELEAIVAWFDGDDFDLDKAIEKFERGAELAKELKTYLKETENTVEKIQATLDK